MAVAGERREAHHVGLGDRAAARGEALADRERVEVLCESGVHAAASWVSGSMPKRRADAGAGGGGAPRGGGGASPPEVLRAPAPRGAAPGRSGPPPGGPGGR